MSYMEGNKAAWEEAFDNRRAGWGEDNWRRLKNERLPFFRPDLRDELEKMDFKGKSAAQFCCNNGRELLSLMQLGTAYGAGFDIAENIIAEARETAQKAGISNCEFTACNILDIPETHRGRYDFIFFTIGAITWFEELTPLFAKAADCLKDGGLLMINDFHPLMNMLPLPGEDGFDPDNLNRLAYSYFREEPWIENDGADYMSDIRTSNTFTSFSHTMSAIINALSACGLRVVGLNEYDRDVGLADSDIYDNKGFPLSFTLTAEKS